MSGRRQRNSSGNAIIFIGFVLGHGGDAAQMLDLAHGLVSRGRTVKVVVPAVETTVPFAAAAAARGITVKRTRLLKVELGGVHQNPLQVVALLARYRRSLVHFHTGDLFLPRSVGVAMRALAVPPAVVTVHSPWDDGGDEGRARSWVATVAQHLAMVVCPSKHSREAQLRYGVAPAKVTTIYNAVDVDRFGAGEGRRAYDQLGLGPEARLIVFSSRIDGQKHPLDAVQAFSKVAAEHPEAHLVFVGRGEMEAEVRVAAAATACAERIHFAGFQHRVEDWLAASTVWYLPTERENFSIAVLEAMAAGCAIVSTDCHGNDEVLDDGANALLTAVGDVDAQAAAIHRILDDDELAQGLRRRALADSAAYGIGRMIDEYEATYAAAR